MRDRQTYIDRDRWRDERERDIEKTRIEGERDIERETHTERYMERGPERDKERDRYSIDII